LSLVVSKAIFGFVTGVDESQIYSDLMRFKPDGLSPNAWAVRAGVSRTVWADMRKHGNPSRRTLEKLLAVVGSSLAEFEALRLGSERPQKDLGVAPGQIGDVRQPWGPATLPPLPLVASSLGGEWNESGNSVEITEIRPHSLIDRLPRPLSVAGDPDAFALTVVGVSMWPRFRVGSRIAVSPRSSVGIGDDVVARLRDPAKAEKGGTERALIMHLVKRAGGFFELRQFNPDLTIRIGVTELEGISRIVGELI
jgi:hypothetical protein